MNIYLHELKAIRKSTIIWTLSLIGIMAFFMSLLPTISSDAAEYTKVLQSYPEALRKALSISIDTIASTVGFYSFTFLYILLCGSIQAMNLGLSVLSKETREKTADFLLTKPVPRTKIITSKILAALTSLVITNIFYLAAAGIMAGAVSPEPFSWKIFYLISVSMFFIQLIFLAMGVIISVVARKIKSVVPLSLCIVFSFLILSMFGSIIGDKIVKYITPFKYFDTAYIIKNSAYDTKFLIISAVFIVAAIIATYIIYSKKDIHAV